MRALVVKKQLFSYVLPKQEIFWKKNVEMAKWRIVLKKAFEV